MGAQRSKDAYGSAALRPPARRARRMRSLPTLTTDNSGSAAIEFGLVGVVIILLVIEAMQVGFYFYTEAVVERATSKAARQILTGGVANQSLSADQFRANVLCPLLAPGISCSSIVTNIQTVSEGTSPGGFYAFVNANQTALVKPAMDNTKTAFCPGQNGSYVFLQVYYAMPVFSPTWLALGSTTWNGSTVHFISSTAAFKNEPFQIGTQSASTC